MTASVFHATPAELACVRAGFALTIIGPEARHAVSVMRMQPGEGIELVDGAGRRVRGTIASIDGRDSLGIDVADVIDEPVPDLRLAVIQALPKGEHAELAVDLMTQVGVDAIVPWAAQRCVAQWKPDRAEKARAKWQAAAAAAAKQSRRARTPVIGALATLADACALVSSAAVGLVLHEEASASLADAQLPSAGEIVIVVGPEGGLADDERAGLRDA
ncbi:MAG: 16S rRNA (uracil(1498)-N(3))-methyltransferase, partial [Actinobacteria bacterium]|nr:16S rRNA (uracil(1498)-N(3))-methyltransferase [Actinomycetota bacterium]